MDLVRCDKGHWFDASIHSTCPQCEMEAGGAASGYGAPSGGMDAIGPTGPVSSGFSGPDLVGSPPPMGGIGPTEPLSGGGPIGATMPLQDPGFTPTDFAPGAMAGQPVQEFGSTQPFYVNGVQGFNPVTGWLVCVDGPDQGTDYRIRSGYNYIGRGQNMDICILNDSKISRDRHAFIAFDPVTKTFFCAPFSGQNMIYLNGKPLMQSQELAPYDILTIGSTKLCFVPFCGEQFSWDTVGK